MFDWAAENGLELNVKKTKAILFVSARNLAMLPDNLPQIMISGSPILVRSTSKKSRIVNDSYIELATTDIINHEQSLC